MENSIRQPYFTGINALRGIATMIVLFSHYFGGISFMRIGWAGTVFFLALSGFLITTGLLRARDQPQFFRNFYVKRLLRILPVYYVCLTGFFLYIHFMDPENKFAYYKTYWYAYYLHFENWIFVFKGLPQENHFNHLWALAVAEQFYLFWPVLIYFLDRKHLVRWLWIGIVVVFFIRLWVWYYWGDRFEVYYCNTLTRLDSAFLGALLACTTAPFSWHKKYNRYLLWAGLPVLLFCLYAYPETYYYNPYYTIVGYTLASYLMVLFIAMYTTQQQQFRLLKTSRVLNYLGKISFSIYLFHMPVYLFLKTVSMQQLLGPVYQVIPVELISLVLTLAVCSLTYYLIEAPFIRLKKYAV